MKITFNKVFFYLFVFAWSGFILWNLITPPRIFSENENRYLADFPEFSFDKFINGDYMKEMDEYINDQFVIRDRWIRIKTMMERAIGKQEINSVYFAKEGYLIERHNDGEVSEELAEQNREYLSEFTRKYVARLGKDHVKVMLVPTASEILTDKLPPFATGYNQNAYVTKLITFLTEDSFVDIRDILMEHKDEYIYYRTDHHWTALGAFYAYDKWVKEAEFTPIDKEKFTITLASDQFYGTMHSRVNTNVKPDSIYLYELKKDMNYQLTYNLEKKTDSLYDLKKLEGKDKYSVYMGGNNALVEVQTNLRNGRKLLVIKDSFAHSFVPYAVNHYEETHMIDLRYFNGGLEAYIKANEITDVLVLYNVMGFIKDINLGKLLK